MQPTVYPLARFPAIFDYLPRVDTVNHSKKFVTENAHFTPLSRLTEHAGTHCSIVLWPMIRPYLYSRIIAHLRRQYVTQWNYSHPAFNWTLSIVKHVNSVRQSGKGMWRGSNSVSARDEQWGRPRALHARQCHQAQDTWANIFDYRAKSFLYGPSPVRVPLLLTFRDQVNGGHLLVESSDGGKVTVTVPALVYHHTSSTLPDR